MRVLILGGNGFIGTNLCLRLGEKFQTVVIGRSAPKQKLENIKYIQSDISNLALIDYHIRNTDVMIYLTTSFVPSNSNKQPKETLSDTKALVDILELLRYHQQTKLIYFSTGGAVYGNVEVEKVKEDYPKQPISGYGVCKLANESYINLYSRLYNIKTIIVRPSNPYGPYQRTDGKQGVISRFMHLAKNQEKIRLINNGNDVRDFIYIDDLTDLLTKMLHDFKEGTYNVGSGQGIEIKSIIKIIENELDIVLDKEVIGKRNFDVSRIVLDSSNAENTFNWKAKTTLDDGISKLNTWLNSKMRMPA